MKRRFTLIEILVVLAIMALVLGVVLPRVLRIPKRVQVEGAHTHILSALRECGVRAVASGRTVRVRLEPSGRAFQVTSAPPEQDALSDSKLPDGIASEPVPGSSLVITTKATYKIPKGVTWETDQWDMDPEEAASTPLLVFHADGSASGPDLVFVVVKRRFLLHVDHLTGRPEIEELVE